MSQDGNTSIRSRAERADEFTLLFGRHARQIYAYILTLIPHWADAEDVFQETSTRDRELIVRSYAPGATIKEAARSTRRRIHGRAWRAPTSPARFNRRRAICPMTVWFAAGTR